MDVLRLHASGVPGGWLKRQSAHLFPDAFNTIDPS